MKKIVCISDTHGYHHQLKMPKGDVLLHAGDISRLGTEEEIQKFDTWLGTLDYEHKIMIAGNHDFLFEKEPQKAQSLITNAIYLENSGIKIDNIHIWGSPITPWFFDWAFNEERGEKIKKYWDNIPENVDILITHGPPLGVLDCTKHGKYVGCEELLPAVERLKPKIHLFGHIHEAFGEYKNLHTHFINASMLDVRYRVVNEPVVVDWG